MAKSELYQDIYLQKEIENELFLVLNNYLKELKQQTKLNEKLMEYVSENILDALGIVKVSIDTNYSELKVRIMSTNRFSINIDSYYAQIVTESFNKAYIPLKINYFTMIDENNPKDIAYEIYSELQTQLNKYISSYVNEFVNSITKAINKLVLDLEDFRKEDNSLSFKIINAGIYQSHFSKEEKYAVLYELEISGKDINGKVVSKTYSLKPIETLSSALLQFFINYTNKTNIDYLSEKYPKFSIKINSTSFCIPTKIQKAYFVPKKANEQYEIEISAYNTSKKDLLNVDKYLAELYDMLIIHPLTNIGKHANLFDYLIKKGYYSFSIPIDTFFKTDLGESLDYRQEFKLLQDVQEDLNVVYSALDYNIVAFEKELNEFKLKYKQNSLGYFYTRKQHQDLYYPIKLIKEFSYLGNTYKYYFINDQYRNGKRKEKIFIKNNEKISKKEYKKALIQFKLINE